MGAFIDKLGRSTRAGRWLWFVTLTYRTPRFDRAWKRDAAGRQRLIFTRRTEPLPWARGLPVEQAQAHPDFVHHFFARMIQWIEGQVHARVEYFTVDQFGEVGGRLHQHCGLSWPGLFEYRWKDLQQKLWQEAGFNRILPWEMDAGYYIGRYIGRETERSYWNFRVGSKPFANTSVNGGRRIVVRSMFPYGETRKLFNECRPTIRGWHR